MLFSTPTNYARYLGVNIGDNNLIGWNHWSSEPYLITIGNHCQLTNCVILTHGGGNVVRCEIPDFDVFGKVEIKDWAYVGSGSLIMPGVTIGEGALVAAGSVVTKSIPPGIVVGGNPAQYICTVKEYINRNSKFNLNSKKLSDKRKRELILSVPDYKLIKKKIIISGS